MRDDLVRVLSGQFEASLAMLGECIRQCPEALWEEPVAVLSFRQVVYHTLFFTDFYLSPAESQFELRELHRRGGDERSPGACPGLGPSEALEYVLLCREKLLTALAAETDESLRAHCGFSWRSFSRGELHLYNVRHIQHHVGQLSARLRSAVPSLRDRDALPWVGSGWR